MPPSARNADLVLTDSRFSASEIVDVFGISPSKIRIVQPGMKIAMETAGASPISTESPYLLCSSAANFSPHKNIPILLRAFKQLALKHPNLRLIITGKPTPLKLATIQSETPDLLAQGRIELTGFVPDERLAALYRGAVACIVPSLYEGLGLPVLEAQALRCPVIASDCASLPEVLGNPDLIFRHDDPDSLVKLCDRLLLDKDFRQSAQEQGTRNLASYDNLVAAEAFLDACESIH